MTITSGSEGGGANHSVNTEGLLRLDGAGRVQVTRHRHT